MRNPPNRRDCRDEHDSVHKVVMAFESHLEETQGQIERLERAEHYEMAGTLETFDREWWRTYRATLAGRFGQDTIHVRALPVEMPDEGEA
jgi:hypothetical protein